MMFVNLKLVKAKKLLSFVPSVVGILLIFGFIFTILLPDFLAQPAKNKQAHFPANEIKSKCD